VLESRLNDYDALILSLGLQLHASLIASAPQLKFVATSTTGTDHIDVAQLERQGVELISLKYDTDFLSSISATAELAFALMLSVIRHLPRATASVERGEWDRMRFQGLQLRGRTLGILGYGRLGKIMQELALGFRMRVLAHDRNDCQSERAGVTMVSLDRLLRESDVLSIHIHLTDENYHFLDRERLARMKPGAILVNTSRGAIVDQAALLELLASGHLAGAGVDVLEGEWDENLADHPMVRYAREHDNLVITPHIGGCCIDAMEQAMGHTVAKLLRKLSEWHE
jgi:D-3-phosphoglycerate dehydrogenase